MLVASQDESLGELANADVLVEGRTISAVGKDLKVAADETIDARGRLIVPGFINTHHHLIQVLTRAVTPGQDAELFDWLVAHYGIWRHLSGADLQVAAKAGLGELLLSGCTCCADQHYVCPGDQGEDLFACEAEAAAELGIRLHLSRGSMSLGRSRGGLPPDEVVQDEDFILNDSQRVVERFHDPSRYSMCRVVLAPCSPFSVTPELMQETANLARRLGVRLHTHLAETKDEENFCLDRFGKRPLAYVQDLGWLGPDVWLAHCVHLDAGEIALLAQTKTGVAHCPVSNLRLGSGIAPVPAMLAAGVPVGLAVDGSASNDSSNMLRELQLALLVHRIGTGPAAMTARQVLRMATVGGAQVLGRDDTGVLAPGYAADLAMFDLRGLAYAGARHDPVAALLFCGLDQRAELVMANGEIVVRDQRLCNLDEWELADQVDRASRRLLQATSA